MRVLVIDNYDSFTFNLVQYLGELGAEPEVVRNDAAGVDELLERGAGPGARVARARARPPRPGLDARPSAAFAEAGVPVLGVCLGHQALAAAFGGRVVRGAAGARQGRRGRARRPHDLRRPGLAAARPAATTRSSWTPTCRPSSSARRTPGDTVMAIRHRELPAEGVQFHPESVLTGPGMEILRNFLAVPARAPST